MPVVSDRYEQARLGNPRYFTGRECKRGHFSERYVVNGACIECVTVKIARRFSKARNVGYPDKPFIFPLESLPKGEAIPWPEIFEVLRGWVLPAYNAVKAARETQP